MKSKRVIAFVLALIIIVLNGWSQSINKERLANSVGPSTIRNFFNKVDEVVIEEGNPSKKIVVLNYQMPISGGLYHKNFMMDLETIRNDENVKGILLHVDSPGGGVYEAREIKDKLDQIKDEKKIPIYGSMGSVAASGAYYILAGTDKIYASPETLTGSIGVIMEGFNFSGLMDKLGVQNTVIKSAENKGMGSAFSDMTPEQQEIFQNLINNSYDRFVKTVSKGRKIAEDKVREIADGRVYDGEQAKNIGLIDEMGYTEEALESLKKDSDLEDAKVITYDHYDNFTTLFDLSSQDESSVLDKALRREIDESSKMKKLLNYAPKLLYLYGGE